MKILITGGAGFIGKWIVEKLPSETEIVIVDSLDEQVHKTSRQFAPELQARATCIKADVRDIEAYREAAEGTDVIVNLVAQTGTGQSMYEISKYVQHNADGTAKLLELISTLKQKPRRIVLSSSRAVYGEGAFADGTEIYYTKGRRLHELQKGIWEVCNEQGKPLQALPMRETQLANPTSVYGLTKLWQEQLVQNYCDNQNIDAVIFRFQNVYGPKQELGNPYTGIIGIFTNSIVQKNSVELFEDGLMTRDFVFVGDVAEAVVKSALYKQPISSIINIGSGQATTLKELVEIIAHITNKKPEVRISGRFRVGDIRHAVADMSCYETLLGEWKPTPLEQGLREYLSWYLGQVPPSEADLQTSLKEMEQKGLLKVSK
ncbi:SDR family NAD(P)-dependent oxidoreductase [Scytonema tolypothrichoides VB-61278]|nr:SDR family NAD(P)-dependent oxidoreductase [Scytonema tolypothrichoides VB-61278]